MLLVPFVSRLKLLVPSFHWLTLRLLFHLAPVVFLAVAQGVWSLKEKSGSVVAGCVFLWLMAHPIIQVVDVMKGHDKPEDFRPVYQAFVENAQPGDEVYAYFGNHYQLKMHALMEGRDLSGYTIRLGPGTHKGWSVHREQLTHYDRRRFWLLTRTHHPLHRMYLEFFRDRPEVFRQHSKRYLLVDYMSRQDP